MHWGVPDLLCAGGALAPITGGSPGPVLSDVQSAPNFEDPTNKLCFDCAAGGLQAHRQTVGYNLVGKRASAISNLHCAKTFGGVRGAVSRHHGHTQRVTACHKRIHQEPEAHLVKKDKEGASTVLRSALDEGSQRGRHSLAITLKLCLGTFALTIWCGLLCAWPCPLVNLSLGSALGCPIVPFEFEVLCSSGPPQGDKRTA